MTIHKICTTNKKNKKKNKFLGVDKVLFGMTLGFMTFIIAAGLDKLFRAKNNGKVLFNSTV